MSAVQVKFYDAVEDRLLKFAAILAGADGGRMFCRHKQRDTWEVPGGSWRRKPARWTLR